MATQVDTIVVGGGQAGLAASYFLTEHEREHLVLERGLVGETWRSNRWDGFVLNTPNWAQLLPGHEYSGDDRDAFAPLTEVIEYLESYAQSFQAPVREQMNVTALRLHDGDYSVEAEGELFLASNVIVATGAFQQPTAPAPGAETATGVLQLSTSAYRRPDQLPDGAVLVVGSGQSGCQIADELLNAGRTVYLAAGRCPWFPRRYRGREIVGWALDLGLMDQTVDTLPSPAARLACNPPVSGSDGGHDCHPRWLARRGAVLVGRVRHVDGSKVSFEPGLEQNLAAGDQFVADLKQGVDAYIAAQGIAAPEAEPAADSSEVPDTPDLDLRRSAVTTILWATGFRPDYSWIEPPFADEYGWPIQQRGVTPHPGLYVVGVQWLHKRKSALFCGVGEYAEHVSGHLCGSR